MVSSSNSDVRTKRSPFNYLAWRPNVRSNVFTPVCIEYDIDRKNGYCTVNEKIIVITR